MTLPFQVLEVITFWFHELQQKAWFEKDTAIDEKIRTRFADLHQQASMCELSHWRATIQGRLAEILILDQFSRNLYRNEARSFANDNLALALAQEAIATGHQQELLTPQRAFLYMPFMHSESLHIHNQAMKLFSEPGLEQNLKFEIRHREIIERFGRYPHRNQILGRQSTPEEIEFLKGPGSSF